MMKNGRPYSIENGWEDKCLITDLPKEDVEIAMKWISEHISPAKRLLKGRSSYGIKHLLQEDTELYLTNNQFKDAMLQAGYEPVDENELNWRYRIRLKIS